MMRARSSQIRKLGNMTLIPSLMNANDILIYGLPLAFNRHLMIPFFLVPLVNLGIAFTAFSFGLMRAPALLVPPYVPAPFGAFLACGGDFRAIAVTCASIIIGMMIYSFFLSSYDLKATELEEIPDPESRPRRMVI
jgi:PTS system cellobiose-specific IIC component